MRQIDNHATRNMRRPGKSRVGQTTTARRDSSRSAKPYTEMNTAELAAATRNYDADFVFEQARALTAAERSRHARARRRGRPRVGLGAEKIRVSVERGLLARADAFASAHRLSRSELIARGLRAVLVAAGGAV